MDKRRVNSEIPVRAIILTLLLLIFFTSCQKKSGQIEDGVYTDTLLRNYIIEQFDLKKRWSKEYLDERIAEQHESHNEIILRPGGFKLQYFRIYEDFRYSPFAIKITNVKDSTLGYFTFTDEIHYMQHDVSAMFDTDSTIKILRRGSTHPGHTLDINLEKNLNKLIQNLSIQKDKRQITNLVNNLFLLTLSMKKAEKSYVMDVIDHLKEYNSKDSLVLNTTNEYNELLRVFNHDDQLIIMPKEGSNAFWKLSIEGDTSNYYVKARLIGGLFFFQIRL